MKCNISRLTTALLVYAGVLSFSLPSVAADFVLRVAHTNVPGDVLDRGVNRLKERLEELTNGRATLEIFPNGQLGDELQTIQGVQLGTIDMAVTANAAFSNAVDAFQVFDLPFLIDGEAHLSRIVNGPAWDKMLAAASERGFHLLGVYSSGVRHLITEKPIRDIKDLENSKIRTMQNSIHIAAFEAFGANPIALSYSELYGALQTGVVDGAESGLSNYEGQKFYEVANHVALVGWLTLSAPLFISEAKFSSLPADIREALIVASADSASYQREYVAGLDQPLHDKLVADGVEFTSPNREPFRRIARDLYGDLLTTPEQKELLRLVQETK